MSLYRLVFEKSRHLSVKFKYRAFWIVKQCNMDLEGVEIHRKLELQELEEIRNETYADAVIYKERSKTFHNQ